MTGIIEKGFLFGLGALTLTRDKIKEFVNSMVEEGEVRAEEASSVVDKLVERGKAEREAIQRLIQEELEKQRSKVPVATKKDMERLSEKVDRLAIKVETMEKEIDALEEEE